MDHEAFAAHMEAAPLADLGEEYAGVAVGHTEVAAWIQNIHQKGRELEAIKTYPRRASQMFATVLTFHLHNGKWNSRDIRSMLYVATLERLQLD